MPVHRVKGGWRWGASGKVYPTLRQAKRQGAAAFANGYRADQTDRKKQRRAAKLLRASKRAEARFERELVALLRGVHSGFRKILHEQLELRKPESRMNRADAGDPFPPGLMARLFVYVTRGVGPAFDAMAKTVDGDNEEALKLFGIAPGHVPGLAGILASARQNAMQRVQQAASKYASQVQQVLADPKNADLRVEELAGLLEDRASVSESEARFIARDTTLKTNADVTRMRQQAAGVEEYRWSTSQDERVRPMHAELEGEKFAYDDPPVTNDEGETNNPGEDWQCRCIALPVISFLEEPAPEEGEEAA